MSWHSAARLQHIKSSCVVYFLVCGISSALSNSSSTTALYAGLLFALFSGTPLIITGVTGPVLLYDEALFQFSDGVLPYLSWRVWIGLWTTVIALAVAAFQASKESSLRP